MRRSVLAAFALLGALLLPGAAAAQTIAYSVPGNSNMRAGPGQEFPVIAQVVGGSRVNINGCLRDGSWCDSTVQGFRGWISTSRLEFAYAGRRVLVPEHYASFGAPVIGFDFGYWDRNYQDRRFYRDRGRFDRDWHGRRDRDDDHGRRRSRRDGDGDRGRDRDRDDDVATDFGEDVVVDDPGQGNGGGERRRRRDRDGDGGGGGFRDGGGEGGRVFDGRPGTSCAPELGSVCPNRGP